MKISLELPKVLGMLDIAARFVSKNSTLPILQNIYLKASIDTLLIRATDMEKYVDLNSIRSRREETGIICKIFGKNGNRVWRIAQANHF